MLPVLIPSFLCWGSFLNVLAHRLIHNESLFPRSRCTNCQTVIAWYDNIPVISWIILNRQCRHCSAPISWLYPAIEALTALLLTALFLHTSSAYFLGYAIFFSALIVTIRSDLEHLLISRFTTLFLIPVAFLLSATGFLPISLTESVASVLIGYALLYSVASLFYLFTKKQGLGQGDIDLLAFIGAFIGLFGLWTTLLISSLSGSIIGLAYLLITRSDKTIKIPFGPFLATGAILFVFLESWLAHLFFIY